VSVNSTEQHINREAARAFAHVVRERDLRRQLLLRGKKTQSKALNEALELEAVDMEVGMLSWLQQVSLKLNP
jgi:replicative DNA helicase